MTTLPTMSPLMTMPLRDAQEAFGPWLASLRERDEQEG